jgi:mannosyltransferase OCH1-like enzyme
MKQKDNYLIYIALFLFIIVYIYIQLQKLNKFEGFENEEIPRKVFQTWKTHDMPEKMKANRDRMIELNPEFEYILMDDKQCRDFIKENFDYKTLNAYDSLVPGAYKADLWRYCVLYKYGGIYLDIKLRPADDYKLTKLLDDEHFVLDRKEYFKPDTLGIYNACMVQKKGNKCMKECIEKIIENVETNYYGYNDLYPTGPGLLGLVYRELYEDDPKVDLVYIGQEKGQEKITHHGKIIIHAYPEYRIEAPSSGTYGHLWNSKNIYK